MLRETRDPVASSSGLGQEDPLTRRAEGNRRFGRSGMPTGRSRLYDYDRHEGKAKATYKGDVVTAGVMAVDQARVYLSQIHDAFGVGNAMEEQKFDFDHFLFLCYALNGGSAIMPSDRASFSTRGSVFEFKDVMAILGVHFRRFFRAFANDILIACRRLYEQCDYEDSDEVELRARMISVARARGLSRAPWLIPDCLDAATNLTEDEGHIVLMAKGMNVSKTVNSVDRRAVVQPVRSADNYDSSTGQSISLDNDVRGHVPQYTS